MVSIVVHLFMKTVKTARLVMKTYVDMSNSFTNRQYWSSMYTTSCRKQNMKLGSNYSRDIYNEFLGRTA